MRLKWAHMVAVEERNVLVGWYSCNWSRRYAGGPRFFALKVTVTLECCYMIALALVSTSS